MAAGVHADELAGDRCEGWVAQQAAHAGDLPGVDPAAEWGRVGRRGRHTRILFDRDRGDRVDRYVGSEVQCEEIGHRILGRFGQSIGRMGRVLRRHGRQLDDLAERVGLRLHPIAEPVREHEVAFDVAVDRRIELFTRKRLERPEALRATTKDQNIELTPSLLYIANELVDTGLIEQVKMKGKEIDPLFPDVFSGRFQTGPVGKPSGRNVGPHISELSANKRTGFTRPTSDKHVFSLKTQIGHRDTSF